MRKCIDCGHIFEDGESKKVLEEIGEFWGNPAFMERNVCPICGGEHEEIKPCKRCGGYSDGEDFCEECKKEVLSKFQKMMAQFTSVEKELLNEEYDGKEF